MLPGRTVAISTSAALLVSLAGGASVRGQTPLGTAFTYQGQLQQSGAPVNGVANLQFSLWNAASGPNQVGGTQTINGVSVSDGQFTVTLNAAGEFGTAPFSGQQRWLEITVNGTPLWPRQALTGTPNALFALNAATATSATTAGSATNATQLNGQAAAFYQNASNLSSGTLADPRLSVNIPRLNTANAFGKFINTFGNNVGIGNTNPLALLHVGDAYTPTVAGSVARFNGEVCANGTLVSDQGALLSRSAAGQGVASMILDAEADAGGASWFINSNSNTSPFGLPGGSLTFENGAAAMTITAARNIGIGTRFPQKPLHVAGETRMDGVLIVTQPAYALADNDVVGLDGGALVVGSDSQGLKMDHNTIQARTVVPFEGTPVPTTLELNPAGGAVEIANPPFGLDGTLRVGGGGIGTNALSVGDIDDLGTFEVNGNTLRVTAGATGKVGIGEFTPEAKLDVREANNRVALFNRTGSDGTLVNWQRDSTNVGSVSVAAGVVSYNAFTGSHYGWLPEGQSIEPYALVRMTGENRRAHNDPESEIIYGIEANSRANDPACLGAYLALSESTRAHNLENPHLIMAVGNGELWVVDTGASIQPGDYLISSDVRGCAMRDDPVAYPIGHIVARAAERLDWAGVKAEGSRKRARIPVLFGNFVRHSGGHDLARVLQGQQEQIDLLRRENARLTGQLQALLGEVRQIKAERQDRAERPLPQAVVGARAAHR